MTTPPPAVDAAYGPEWKDQLERIVRFLRSVGLEPIEAPLDETSFLPGVAIVRGRVTYDPQRLRWPGDLLHEAGHIAITPPNQRAFLDATLPPLSADHAGEVEATAWAYAATVAIGLDPIVLFHEGGYQGHSRELAFSYSMGCFPGVNGLRAAGMAHSETEAAGRGTRAYPAMLHWLRP